VTSAPHPDARAAEWAQRLTALREPRMRQSVVVELLRGEAPDVAVQILHALVARHRAGPTTATTAALESVAAALGTASRLPYEARADLYEAAHRLGHDEVARMLFEGSDAGGDADAAAARPLRPRGKPLSLGERKALARGNVRDVLESLLLDPHPDVIAILLGNPHLTERDVLAIATRRPAPADALAAVAASETWIARYAVKRALVLNPDTPAPLAIRLLATLKDSDLRMVAADENLPDAVRDQARSLLGETPGSP
jgi:hypothetical protein